MDTDSGHPDEGTIHAWLDGQLGPEESERFQAHVGDCEACGARVAEARGLLAGSSRIVGLLDEAPSPTVRRAEDASLWRALRVTPARAAIAAALIVAVGLTLTRPRAAVENTRMAADSVMSREAVMSSEQLASAPAAASPPQSEMAPSAATGGAGAANPVAAPASPPTRDRVLESAVARRLSTENPQRVLRATPDPVASANVAADASAPAPTESMGRQAAARVAEGRAEARIGRVQGDASADKLRARAPGVAARAGASCYRLESAGDADERWRGAPLPFSVALGNVPAMGSSANQARLGVTAVGGSRLLGSWAREGEGLSMELVGETVTTTARLGPGGDRREGTLSAEGRTISVVARRVGC